MISLIAGLVLVACNPVKVVDPTDDTILLVNRSGGVVQALGMKRLYEIIGVSPVLTVKGVKNLKPGECFDFNTSEISLYPIDSLIPMNKDLEYADVEQAAHNQNYLINTKLNPDN